MSEVLGDVPRDRAVAADAVCLIDGDDDAEGAEDGETILWVGCDFVIICRFHFFFGIGWYVGGGLSSYRKKEYEFELL